MGTKIRKAGIACVGEIPWGTHMCQFYQNRDDLLEVLIPYFKSGLESNEFCLWITSDSLSDKEAQKALRKAVPSLDRYLRIGQIKFVPQTDWSLTSGTFNPQGLLNSWVDKLVQALANGYDGIRITADRSWLEKMEWKTYSVYEEKVNEAIRKYPMLVLCTYSLDRCDRYKAAELIEVVRFHELALIKRKGQWDLVSGSERRQSEEELWDLTERLHTLLEAVDDGAVFLDVEGNVTTANKAAITLTGFNEPEELIGRSIFDFVSKKDRGKFMDTVRETFEGGQSTPIECTISAADGRQFPAELTAALIADRAAKPMGFIVLVEDISDRKQTEKALQDTERLYHLVAHNVSEVIWTTDLNLQPTYVSPSVKRLLGYDSGDGMKHIVSELLTPASREMAMSAIAKALSADGDEQKEVFKSQCLELEIEMKRRDGTTVWTDTRMSFVCGPDGRPAEIMGVVRDVTERKRVEELFMILSSNSPVGIYIVRDGKFVLLNPRCQKLTGFSEEELLGAECLRLVVPEDREGVRINAARMLKGERFSPYEYRYVTKDGKTRWAMEKVAAVQYRGQMAVLGNFMDITERKIAEEALRESEQRYRLVAENVTDVIFTMDINLHPTYVSPSVTRLLGYSVEEATINMMERIWTPASRDLLMRAVAKALTMENLGRREWFKPQILELQMKHKDGSTVWTETTMSLICDSHGMPVEIMGMVSDITDRKLAEEQLQRSLDKLEKAMEGTIQAISLTVETKDRYTAGHQRRVAQLASAIGKEMGLSEDRVHGLRVAGLLHDIGKICVPTEILSKPGQLTPIEFAMIKTHPQVGYDILKTIEFPWPIAEIVLQHHERTNGSGYHSGIGGNDILLEARILGVADVVEAMSSHRPYRLALGVDRALEEISQNRGVLYDADVVDACAKVFLEKNFAFDAAT